MSDDSDIQHPKKSKYKVRYLDESSNSSDSSLEAVVRKKPGISSKTNRIPDSDSDSDSSIDYIRKRKRIGKVNSDTSTSSGSVIVKRSKKPPRVVSESDRSDGGFEGSSSSDWESDFSSDMEFPNQNVESVTASASQDGAVNSDSSDDQAEKCPICLLTFKQQEVGTPEACDHTFCVECILEWSRSVNTCPVDRQPFNLILVRDDINGRIVREVQVDPPTQQQQEVEILEDPTYCEICGSCDREDRMLLCDGCDLGFHLDCLNPPLEDIPTGFWYCDGCSSSDEATDDIGIYEVHLLLDEAEEIGRPSAPRRSNESHRLVPRTRQSERVRQRVARDRHSNTTASHNHTEHPSTSSGFEDSVQPGPSRRRRVATQLNNVSSTRRKTKPQKRRRKPRYRTVYEVDELTGGTVAVKKRIKRRRRKKASKKTRERARQASLPKTVKKRLAVQLGICHKQKLKQHVPDVKIQTSSNRINFQRHQAGIPTLHLFGQHDELDYFSDSDGGYEGFGVLLRRRSNMSDASVLRRQMRRKTVHLPSSTITTETDLLGSILDSQARLHSRSSVLSLNEDGTLKVDTQDKSPIKKEQVNINNNRIRCRQMPTYPTGTSSDSTAVSNNQRSATSSPEYRNFVATSTVSTSSAVNNTGSDGDFEGPHDYSQSTMCALYESENKKKKEQSKEEAENGQFASVSGDNTPRSTASANSDSELDIYSDIETVSTSKVDEPEVKPVSSPVGQNLITGTDDENNDSDADLVIDTEKVDPERYDPATALDSEENTKEETVSSTVDSTSDNSSAQPVAVAAHSTMEVQSQAVQSTSQIKLTDLFSEDHPDEEEDDASEDGCPNFSIYSTESINIAKTTDLELLSENSQNNDTGNNHVAYGEVSSTPMAAESELKQENIQEEKSEVDVETVITDVDEIVPNNENKETESDVKSEAVTKVENVAGGLYSDDEDEVKIDLPKAFGIGDIRNMTEDISEEERSYTPCLDEKGGPYQEGLDGLDTEMISDEDRNDFDESHELKTASDGDALEINAKESELDFTKPEDYEEGEIVDKIKAKKLEESKKDKKENESEVPENKKVKKKEKEVDDRNKENENQNKESFKKLSKSNKERNYRDKDKERSRSRSKSKKKDRADREGKKEKKKRKEIERYDVRTIIAEKPRRLKDKFGRDIKHRSASRSSRSVTPRRSVSRGRRSHSRERRKRRGRSRERRSVSRSRSSEPRRSRSRTKKRRRSSSREVPKRRKSRDRSRVKNRKSSRSRNRTRSPTPKRRRDWDRRRSREWTPSISKSRTPEPGRHVSPSWTPPRIMDQSVKPHNLTVILTNDSNKKKKDKKKRSEKKNKDMGEKQKKGRRNDRTPPPSKEVFASGDNILVSVSFNKDTDNRDVTTTKRKRDVQESLSTKKLKKDKRVKPKRGKDLTGVKPVAIIDLDRSPFKELTPSPKDIIVLSDSDNAEGNDLLGLQKAMCDSSQQVASPEHTMSNNYSMGPKTPPEPQIKFSLSTKQPQMRPITNPLHEPDEPEEEIDPQEELEERLNDVSHKGPNTPPEPPNSPPSSPDAYDPFDPTKSRSPTPEPSQNVVQSNSTCIDDNREESMLDNRSSELLEKSSTPISQPTPDVKSHTPPLIDTQPDSQTNTLAKTPDVKSPEMAIGVIMNQVVQSQATVFPNVVTSKPVAPTIPYSTGNQSLITSTPISANMVPRINILSSTILTPTNVVSMPQRIVLPNTAKSSPVKIAQSKTPIKSTPIKPMPTKNLLSKNSNLKTVRKSGGRNQNSGDASEIVNLDFDSPYSPGSSDYEDLFEPPAETNNKSTLGSLKPQPKNTKSPAKVQNAFDALFGTSPMYKGKSKIDKSSSNKLGNKKSQISPSKGKKSTKQVGVKLDEDNLKILDELPNSAVEMQVKDKFLKKLNRQERVVEEVKLVLKPHYNKKRINKEEYKDILRRAVPKICHNKSGEINPKKIQNLIEAYVKKVRHSKKVTSSSSVNPQKT